MPDIAPERIPEFIEPFRVRPGSRVRLPHDFDPAFKGGVTKKKRGRELLEQGVSLLSEYQARLAAQDTWGVLVVLQAMDAAGKDGTIRHVMSGVNPQGVAVHSFKVPSNDELDHDFLWRYGKRLPSRGQIAIFNRSHYEEVLVVRVHPELLAKQKLPEALVGKDIWDERFKSIRGSLSTYKTELASVNSSDLVGCSRAISESGTSHAAAIASITMQWSSRCGRPDIVSVPMHAPSTAMIGTLPP